MVVCAVYLLNSSFGIFESGEYLHKSGKRSQGASALLVAVGFLTVSIYTIIFVLVRIIRNYKKDNNKEEKTNR